MRPIAAFFVVPLVMLAGCGGPFIDNPNAFRDEHGRNPQQMFTLDKASIRTEDGRSLDIGRIVLNDGGRYVGSDSRGGLTAVDQNRIGLDALPVIGGVFVPRLHRSDFRESQRIGTVYAGGDTIFIVPDVITPRRPWKRVVLVNGDFAWVFPGFQPVPAPAPSGAAPVVGAAYARGDGETLLVLIRPSIITDSLF